jgi:outer membrane protein TolC
LATRLDEAYAVYEDALRRLDLYRKQMKDARKARGILLEAFRTGDADVDELLELQRKLYRYRSALERARADRNKAVARFKRMLAR